MTNVTQTLREAIFAGAFAPGERIAEARLAALLEVSRATIREALAALEQEGLVSRTSPSGTCISRLSREDAVEICSLRHALELLAIRLALAQPVTELVQSLSDNIERTRAAAGPRQLAALDQEFHELIMRAAGHRRLLKSWLSLRSQVRLIMTHRNMTDAQSHAGTIRAHERMLQLIEARDVAGAAAQVEQHLQAQQAWILRSFEEAPCESSATDKTASPTTALPAT